MGITLTWDADEPNGLSDVVHYHFTDKWTWGDFLVMFNTELEMAASIAPRPYAVIGNLLRSQPLPPGIGITYVYGIFKRYPANHEITVIVTPNAFVRALLAVGIRVHPDARDTFFQVGTLEEARALILRKRAEKEPFTKP
jgi:hypothetical protein